MSQRIIHSDSSTEDGACLLNGYGIRNLDDKVLVKDSRGSVASKGSLLLVSSDVVVALSIVVGMHRLPLAAVLLISSFAHPTVKTSI